MRLFMGDSFDYSQAQWLNVRECNERVPLRGDDVRFADGDSGDARPRVI